MNIDKSLLKGITEQDLVFFKLTQLLSTNNGKELNNLGKYLYFAYNKRSSLIVVWIIITELYIFDLSVFICMSITKDYFGLKCILFYYVPVQTKVSPYDANCVTPLIYPTTDLDFLFGIIVSFNLSFFKPAHSLFVNGIIPSLLLP